MKIVSDSLDQRGQQRRHALSAIAAAVAGSLGAGLAGCGGGGDDSAVSTSAQASTQASAANAADVRRRGLGGVDSGGTGISAFFSTVVSGVTPLVAGGVQFDTQQAVLVDADGNAVSVDELAPGMTTQIGARVSIGSNASILPVTICDDVVIGAGAVVVKDISEPGIYAGNPTRLIRKIIPGQR